MTTVLKRNSGFTLVELMVAMVVAILVLAGIVQTYRSHQKSHTAQQMVIAMQQNARTAMALMKREIRMAGYRPAATDGIDNDGLNGEDDDAESGRQWPEVIGITGAFRDVITFSMDLRSDDADRCTNGADDGGISGVVDDPHECYDGLANDPGELIRYQLQNNAAGDGMDLARWDMNSGGSAQILAYDIEGIAFGFAFDDDEDGTLDTDGGGVDDDVIWAYSTTGSTLNKYAETGADLSTAQPLFKMAMPLATPTIGAVKIWLLARTPNPIDGESDSRTYQVGDVEYGPPGSGADVEYDPAYKRTLQTATVYCRNLRF